MRTENNRGGVSRLFAADEAQRLASAKRGSPGGLPGLKHKLRISDKDGPEAALKPLLTRPFTVPRLLSTRLEPKKGDHNVSSQLYTPT